MSDPQRPAGEAADPEQVVQQLIRTHNVWILVVFVGAVAALAAAQTLGHRVPSDRARLLLNGARVAAPLLAMVVTAAATNRMVARRLPRLTGDEVGAYDVLDEFRRSRVLGMWLLGSAGLLADVSMLLSTRVLDAVLALFALGLLLNFRPRMKALLSFALTVESLRRDEANRGRGGG